MSDSSRSPRRADLVKESRDYPGFVSQPMSWEMARNKFNRLAAPFATEAAEESDHECCLQIWRTSEYVI